jgi:hypothetical protein
VVFSYSFHSKHVSKAWAERPSVAWIRKLSTEHASANELGGIIIEFDLTETNDLSSKAFRSIIALFTLVKF